MRWAAAMERSLYGSAGFFTRQHNGGPTAHFRTSATASPIFAQAMAHLIEQVDAALGHPEQLDVVDIAAGRGELLTGLLMHLPPAVLPRLRPLAVELAERPAGLPEAITWASDLTEALPADAITGVVVATEWLDNVPLDIAELTEDGLRHVLVDDQGTEWLGEAVDGPDRDWITRWWPPEEIGSRIEIGRPRDLAWAGALARLRRGMALAVDYGHQLGDRPPCGTLTGYRDGRQVTPVPDGSCDLTAHVAIDSVAAAGALVAGTAPSIVTQRTALRGLGVTGTRPDLALASSDPIEYMRRLADATAAAELTDQAGLGAHLWLMQPKEIDWPLAIEHARERSARLVPEQAGSGWKEC